MKATNYHLHLQLQFERRWNAMVAAPKGKPRHSPVAGTDICKCGYIVTAPDSSTCWPSFVINEWCCPKCGERWETTADFKGEF